MQEPAHQIWARPRPAPGPSHRRRHQLGLQPGRAAAQRRLPARRGIASSEGLAQAPPLWLRRGPALPGWVGIAGEAGALGLLALQGHRGAMKVVGREAGPLSSP